MRDYQTKMDLKMNIKNKNNKKNSKSKKKKVATQQIVLHKTPSELKRPSIEYEHVNKFRE